MSKPMGRPRKEIDWEQLDSIASLGATLNYCAERQLVRWGDEVSAKTIKSCREIIERRVEERFECTFTEYKDQKMDRVRIGIVGKQVELAMKGNATLLIWVGKVLCGQRDKTDLEVTYLRRVLKKLDGSEIIYTNEPLKETS